VVKVLCDGGCSGEKFADAVRKLRACAHYENMIYTNHEINPGTAEKNYEPFSQTAQFVKAKR
jgi:hypothetical protein